LIEGQVIKGPINSAIVEAFGISEDGVVSSVPIARSTSDTDGSYRLDLGPFQGAVQIVATSGPNTTMRDEASGQILTPPTGFRLRAVTLIQPAQGQLSAMRDGRQIQTVTVSPFSELAAVVAGALGGGKLSAPHIGGALAAVREAIGFDPVATRAVDATQAGAAFVPPDSRMYGLALAAVSWLATHATLADENTAQCMKDARGDLAKRIPCAVQLITGILQVDSGKASVVPKQLALAFTDAVKRVEKDTALNKTGMTLSLAPAMLRLESSAASASQSASPLNTNSGAMSGLAAAKKLFESLRSNADAIDIGMNEEGITAALTGLGKSLDRAGTMATEVGTLIDMLNDSVVHWNEYRAGRRASASFNGLPVPSYGIPPDYFSCSIMSSFLPEDLLNASFFGLGERDKPYIVVSPAATSTKQATEARRADRRFIVDATAVVATQPSEARWLACTLYSKQVPSLVEAAGNSGTELNASTRYQQMVRMKIDAEDAGGRPTRISFVAMTVKQYDQPYSMNDPQVFTRRVNLLDTPLQGLIELAWGPKDVVSARILGNLPPSVDSSMIRTASGAWASREMIRGARYAVDAQVLFAYGETTTRIDLPRLSLQLVPIAGTAAEVHLEADPEAPDNYIVAPKSDNCAFIPNTRLSIAARIRAPEGALHGRVSGLAPPDCGSGTEAANGSIRFNGTLSARNKLGQPLDVLETSLQLSLANRIPTVVLQGKLLLPGREAMQLSLSASTTDATPSAPGTTSLLLGYTQGNFAMTFNGLQQEDFWGKRSTAYFSMSGIGGISAAWAEGDRDILLRENGKTIAEIDTRTGRVLFSDGSFQYIR
jgi:hypothetical protein